MWISVGTCTNRLARLISRSAGLATERREDAMLGELRHHPDFTSQYVAPSNIEFWLPPRYHEMETRSFPVVYMHDGQNLFVCVCAAKLGTWQNVNTSTASVINVIFFTSPLRSQNIL